MARLGGITLFSERKDAVLVAAKLGSESVEAHISVEYEARCSPVGWSDGSFVVGEAAYLRCICDPSLYKPVVAFLPCLMCSSLSSKACDSHFGNKDTGKACDDSPVNVSKQHAHKRK